MAMTDIEIVRRAFATHSLSRLPSVQIIRSTDGLNRSFQQQPSGASRSDAALVLLGLYAELDCRSAHRAAWAGRPATTGWHHLESTRFACWYTGGCASGVWLSGPVDRVCFTTSARPSSAASPAPPTTTADHGYAWRELTSRRSTNGAEQRSVRKTDTWCRWWDGARRHCRMAGCL